jgi:hypothetical protein
MTTQTVQCDKCGIAIESGRTLLTAETGAFRVSWQRNPNTGSPSCDLCGPCAQSFASWLAETPAPEPARTAL